MLTGGVSTMTAPAAEVASTTVSASSAAPLTGPMGRMNQVDVSLCGKA